jgi:DNA (cytosine-5)-methyltransferase 1
VQQKLQKLDSVMLNKVIVEDNIESDFPNVEISLRIFLTNCTTERSFSQMKRIKNPNRTTMRQERLESLSLLMIEAFCCAKLTLRI